jgi:predicted O-methyltransferase YrrM
MEFLLPEVSSYISQYTSVLDSIRKANEEETLQHHPQAVMHSGHVQGKVLEMLSLMIRPHRILEIGTFTGFSALSLAAGLVPGGKLHTIEIRDEDADTAARYFKMAGLEEQIILHRGDAKQIISSLKEQWDLVFIDADKTGYIEYYELTLRSVRSGGWIIADNVLFHGQVLEKEISGKNARAIHAFNEHVKNDDRTQQVILSVRDGLMVIRKN